jgi:hypothetical protein
MTAPHRSFHFLRVTQALARVSGIGISAAFFVACGGETVGAPYDGIPNGTRACNVDAGECHPYDGAVTGVDTGVPYDGHVTGTAIDDSGIAYDGGPMGTAPAPYDGAVTGVVPQPQDASAEAGETDANMGGGGPLMPPELPS